MSREKRARQVIPGGQALEVLEDRREQMEKTESKGSQEIKELGACPETMA